MGNAQERRDELADRRGLVMNNDHDTNVATIKVLIAWIGAVVGGVTLSQLVLGATLIYTLLQIFILLRKLWKGQA
jgi:hypothetical protein